MTALAASHQPPITTVFTVGHSTRTLDEFIDLLRAHDIVQLADIRTVPRSRRHPHFSIEALSVSLPAAGIAYRHMPGLGGLRKPRRDSTNTAWRNASFRGYADYMQTAEFDRAIVELIEWVSGGGAPRAVVSARGPREESESSSAAARASGGGAPRAVIMCAEAVWWRCHRQLVADALVAQNASRSDTSPRRARHPLIHLQILHALSTVV